MSIRLNRLLQANADVGDIRTGVAAPARGSELPQRLRRRAMIARTWRWFRVWFDVRTKRTQVRVVSDESLRLLRLTGTVDEAVAAPPRPQRPGAGLQMNEVEVTALIIAMRSDPMWVQLRQGPIRASTAAAVDLHKLWRRAEALGSPRRT